MWKEREDQVKPETPKQVLLVTFTPSHATDPLYASGVVQLILLLSFR